MSMRPEVFADVKLDEARQRAGGKFLIIDFNATACGPSKTMGENTPVEPEAVPWFGVDAR